MAGNETCLHCGYSRSYTELCNACEKAGHTGSPKTCPQCHLEDGEMAKKLIKTGLFDAMDMDDIMLVANYMNQVKKFGKGSPLIVLD